MNRLRTELQRLYLMPELPTPGTGAPVRAAALELARPAGWESLSALWRGAQAELGLPAPAIAVNGRDGYQLWFSFAQPLPASQARSFVDALRRRYLGEIAEARVDMTPNLDGTATTPDRFALPPRQTQDECWSAFVAPDLAPVFAEEPWVDLPPNLEGQAELLTRLQSIQPADLRAALDRLGASAPAASVEAAVPGAARAAAGIDDPAAFLRQVMNDESVAMALRIEAAKALLPWTNTLNGHRT